MGLKDFSWDKGQKFPKDYHAMFGASNYHWINYSDDKMIETYVNQQGKKKGTELHELAAMLIKQKIKLPPIKQTLNMYVNDAILFGMRPEEQLYYSDLFCGTADAICIDSDVLKIHDLKTGKTKASMHQLEIYSAFFCLQYNFIPSDFDSIELRIYQNNEVMFEEGTSEIIVPIMDKIVTFDRIFKKLKEVD